MQSAAFIQQYGYFAVLFGVMVEGESVLLAAAYAIGQHYLAFWPVIVAAMVGAVCIDHVYFYLGRHHGARWLAKHPKLQQRADRFMPYIQRHQNLILISLRFLIGLRTITPIILGMSQIGRVRFFCFNLVSAGLWAMLITQFGQWLVQVLNTYLKDFNFHEHLILIGFLLLALIMTLLHFIGLRERSRPNHQQTPPIQPDSPP